jgi:hypothetical protein
MSDMVRIAGKVKLAAGRCAGRGQLAAADQRGIYRSIKSGRPAAGLAMCRAMMSKP